MLSTRNRMAYPAGAMAQFNQAHPAAGNTIFSGVAGQRFRSIHKPTIATVSGTETYSIHHTIGPVVEYGTLGGWTLPGFSGAAPAGFTFAAIYYNVSFTNDAWLMCMGVAQFGGVLYCNFSAGAVIAFYSDSGTFVSSGTSYVQGNDPAFVVLSGMGSTWNVISRNLHTGQLYDPATTAVTMAMLANDGIARMGGANMRVAATMCSGTYLPRRAILAWAENPWSFWYPDVA